MQLRILSILTKKLYEGADPCQTTACFERILQYVDFKEKWNAVSKVLSSVQKHLFKLILKSASKFQTILKLWK